MWLWGKEHRGHLSFINPRTYCSEILIPFPLRSIVKVNKYVDGNNKRTSAVCPSHTDTMRDASQLFYTVSVNTSLMTQWACHEESWEWPMASLIDCITWGISHRGWVHWTFICILLAGCHSRVMLDPGRASQTQQEASVKDTSWQLSVAWRL